MCQLHRDACGSATAHVVPLGSMRKRFERCDLCRSRMHARWNTLDLSCRTVPFSVPVLLPFFSRHGNGMAGGGGSSLGPAPFRTVRIKQSFWCLNQKHSLFEVRRLIGVRPTVDSRATARWDERHGLCQLGLHCDRRRREQNEHTSLQNTGNQQCV